MPVTLEYGCPVNCSLRVEVLGEEIAGQLKAAREQRAGEPKMVALATQLLGRDVPHSNMARHLKHYREVVPNGESVAGSGPKPSDLQILDAIIYSGYANSKAWRPGIRDTLEAMRLKVQMTGNSAFDDMLKQMEQGLRLAEGSELGDDEEMLPESNEAMFAPDERPNPEDVAEWEGDRDYHLDEPLIGE